jgi:acyl-CoA thioesterase FadM
MSSFVSRWVVSQRHEVAATDLDGGGFVRDDVIAGWIAEARVAYLDRCRALRELQEQRGSVLRWRDGGLPSGERLGRTDTVVVSAGATELRPTSFTMAFRVRTYGSSDDAVVNTTCVASLEDPVTGEAGELGDTVRDELIALEHAARHTN